ncbi:hypothetical protein EC973_005678 [Apophysomyces ossiformis]|uniref:PB1 domain-containing protein n=1 Tax=Apophysomyces ossiformis TaxID=679940 RepID=A0A8H7ESQ0_9FUNG|nr:hypothetical protein EC973_005678 [Apophysomyces ossiformis]
MSVTFKVTIGNDTRRLELPRESTWDELSARLRSLFSIETTSSLVLYYYDNDRDLLTISSNAELSQLIADTTTEQLHLYDIAGRQRSFAARFEQFGQLIDKHQGLMDDPAVFRTMNDLATTLITNEREIDLDAIENWLDTLPRLCKDPSYPPYRRRRHCHRRHGSKEGYTPRFPLGDTGYPLSGDVEDAAMEDQPGPSIPTEKAPMDTDAAETSTEPANVVHSQQHPQEKSKRFHHGRHRFPAHCPQDFDLCRPPFLRDCHRLLKRRFGHGHHKKRLGFHHRKWAKRGFPFQDGSSSSSSSSSDSSGNSSDSDSDASQNNDKTKHEKHPRFRHHGHYSHEKPSCFRKRSRCCRPRHRRRCH